MSATSRAATSPTPPSNTDTLGHKLARVIALGLPIVVGQAGMVVTGFADTMMVGRYSTEALAAASFTNMAFNTAIFACVGMALGVTPIVGALFARRAGARIGGAVRTALAVNLAFALLVTLIMGAVYAALPRLGQPDELLPVIRPYFVASLAGVVPVSLFNVLAQACYGVNNTRMPMWIILGCNALNVLLNWLLIYGPGPMPELGLTGAGLATLAARWAALGAIALRLALGRPYAAYRAGLAEPRPGMAAKVTRTSVPVMVQMTFESFAFSMSGVMTGWLGAVPLATLQIIIVVGSVGFCIYSGLGAAVAVMVSNDAGAADSRGMRRSAGAGYLVILATAAAACLIFLLWGRQVAALFSPDPAVVGLAAALVVPLVLYQFGDASQICFANALRGTSRVMPMLYVSLGCYLLFQLPVMYVLAFTWGLGVYGIVLGYTPSLLLAGALYFYFFMRATRGHCEVRQTGPAV